jgi:hypothetical protein
MRSKGKSRPDIEAELRMEFERAGIPQTSEQVTGIAQVISNGWFGLLRSAVRVAAGGQAPPGMRASRLRLTGERWVDVEVSADPAAQSAVRRYHRANGVIGSHLSAELNANVLSARLAVIGPDDESCVGVLLGRSFVGTLPRVAAHALAPIIIDADRRDQRVTVSARIDLTGDVCRVSVALP